MPLAIPETIAIDPVRDADLPAILAIHNDAVATSTAIWNEPLADLADRQALLEERRRLGYPFIVARDGDTLVGYATFGDFRKGTGYRYTVEHSIYVHRDHRRRGIARLLMPQLIEAARGAGKHAMVGGIEAGNAGSIALHRAFGFREVGRLPEVGAKFGRWLDLVLMQKLLA